jgi:hypothetical protein
MSKKMNKPMIEYLEIDERFYIENDIIKTRINETEDRDECSWDELWEDALKIMEKIRKYDELHNPNNN